MSTAVLRAVDAATRDPAVRAVSVDVFDTLLLRTTTPEVVKFHRLGIAQARSLAGLGARPLPAAGMLELRLWAAEAAYRNTRLVRGAREPGVEAILGVMADYLIGCGRLDPARRDAALTRLLDVELHAEAADLTRNRPLVALLRGARRRGLPVIALSDMYLRGRHVRQLIAGAGAADAVSGIVVSSDLGFGKACGALFAQLCQDLGIQAGALVHLGDNAHADVAMARRAGVRAFHVPRSRVWRGVRATRQRHFARRLAAA